jgi:hypothetical protein
MSPRAHESDISVLYLTFFASAVTASGGRYEIVPATLPVGSKARSLARPKSAIKILGYASGVARRIFSGYVM